MKIRVKVKPGSKIEELSWEGDNIIVKVKEPPSKGRANQAVVRLLAEYFGVSLNQVRILSGFKSRNKVIELTKG